MILAEISTTLITILICVLAASIALPTTLLALVLQSTNRRISLIETTMTDHTNEITKLKTDQARCKTSCQTEFVTAESWIRSEAYNRQKLDAISEQLGKLTGTMSIVDKMPQICGNIASEIVRQMKTNEAQNVR